MNNEQLMHELMLDPGFRLNSNHPAVQSIRLVFNEQFWTRLTNDAGDALYVRVVVLLGEIRKIMEKISPAHAQSILDVIHTEFGNEVNIVRVVDKLARILGMETPGVSTPLDLRRGLESFLERVIAMYVDAANERVCAVLPLIADHGIDYERKCFWSKLEAGSLTLDRTEAWIRSAMEVAREPLTAVHSHAMVDLLARPVAIRADTCPETLLLDVERLNEMQAELRHCGTPAELLEAISIGKCAERLLPLATRVAALCNLNRTVHLPLYYKITSGY